MWAKGRVDECVASVLREFRMERRRLADLACPHSIDRALRESPRERVAELVCHAWTALDATHAGDSQDDGRESCLLMNATSVDLYMRTRLKCASFI